MASWPPKADAPWPPEELAPVNDKIQTWAVWYSGELGELAAEYGAAGELGDGSHPQRTGLRGIVRRIANSIRRWFHGQASPQRTPRQKVHDPLAGDIAQTSAGLLFSEPPTVTSDDPTTQARLDELLDDGTHATFLEGGEICSALGGVYLRVVWDKDVDVTRPWLAVVHPDSAVPEFQHGRLVAVTFWRIVREDKRLVVRHLERHTKGKIVHSVHAGTVYELGSAVPYSDYEETAWLSRLVTANGVEVTLPEGTPLTAVYVPNRKPNRIWRSLPAAAALGVADIAGLEPMLDSLDMAWSAWMRDIDLSRPRLVVPSSYLLSGGPGEGSGFDLDREVYEGVSMIGGSSGGMQIEKVQFSVPVDEHEKNVEKIKTRIITSAGYSPQTFGLGDAVAVTATEAVARERMSYITRDQKIVYWRPALRSILHALLCVDAEEFGNGVKTDEPPLVEWAPAVSADPESEARTMASLDAARAVSTETKVKRLNPDWDDQAIADEVARIHEENGIGKVEDPDQFTPPPPPGGEDDPLAEEDQDDADTALPNAQEG